MTPSTGRFQLAHRGTLFLKEAGDLPLELQPKLLRFLQEQEFERLGSRRTIRVNKLGIEQKRVFATAIR